MRFDDFGLSVYVRHCTHRTSSDLRWWQSRTYLGSHRATFCTLACILVWAALVAWLCGWCRNFLAWAAFSTTWRMLWSRKLPIIANLEHVRVRKFRDHNVRVLDRSWCGLAVLSFLFKQVGGLIFVLLSAFFALIWTLHTKVAHAANIHLVGVTTTNNLYVNIPPNFIHIHT